MAKSNIVLVGFMYAGKTTVGRLLGASRDCEFIDTDSLIESAAGITIPEVFTRDGEEGFRRMEREVISRVTNGSDSVISLGGGAVLDERNVLDSKRHGIIYFLDAPLAVIVQRAGNAEGRPLLDGLSQGRIAEMMSSRRDAYLRAADVVIDVDERDAQSIADEIAVDFKARSDAVSAGGEPA